MQYNTTLTAPGPNNVGIIYQSVWRLCSCRESWCYNNYDYNNKKQSDGYQYIYTVPVSMSSLFLQGEPVLITIMIIIKKQPEGYQYIYTSQYVVIVPARKSQYL